LSGGQTDRQAGNKILFYSLLPIIRFPIQLHQGNKGEKSISFFKFFPYLLKNFLPRYSFDLAGFDFLHSFFRFFGP
jgi:hypothetical protein